jgi:hypothetical protein
MIQEVWGWKGERGLKNISGWWLTFLGRYKEASTWKNVESCIYFLRQRYKKKTKKKRRKKNI